MKKHEKNFSLQLLLSYLSILIVPLCAIALIYTAATKLMYNVQQEKTFAQLQATAVETQQSLLEACNLGIYISNNRTFTELQQRLQQEQRKAHFYDMYELSLGFPNYSSFNSMVRDVYFFFEQQDYVIRLPVVVPATERSFFSIGSLMANDYSSMQKLLSDEYHDRQVVALSNRSGNGKMLAVVQSFPFGAYTKPFGTALILLNDSLLQTQLAQNLEDHYGIVAMLDSSGQVLTEIVGKNTQTLENAVLYDTLSHERYSETVIQGVRYAVCRAQTENTGHVFYTLIPKTVMIGRIGSIRYLIIALCIASAVIGLGSCFVLWNRRRAVVRRYCRYENEFGCVSKQPSNFWKGVHAVLDSVDEMQNTIRQKLNFERSAIIQKLLFGEYANEDRLHRELETAQIVLDSAGYYAVCIRFKNSSQALPCENAAELQTLVQHNVEQFFALPHYCCEPEDMLLALVVPAHSPQSLHTLKQELHRVEDHLVAQCHVEAFIGIGTWVQHPTELAASYGHACSVCDYLQFYNIRLVMDADSLPRSNDTFFFPMEMELSLIRAIEQGDRAALQDLFRVITYENEQVRTLSPDMKNHLLELVRCTAIRALRDKASESTVQTVGSANTLEKVNHLIEASLPAVAMANQRNQQEHDEKRKAKIEQFIQASYKQDSYTICCLAQQTGVSENKLYKEFRTLFGVSFSDYLENLRIRKACELLKIGTAVKDVSAQVGYCSDYSFRRAFKRVIGLSPTSYTESIDK